MIWLRTLCSWLFVMVLVWPLGRAQAQTPTASDQTQPAATVAPVATVGASESVGYLVGSMARTSDELGFDRQRLWFRHLSGGKEGSVVLHLSPKLIPGSFASENERTRVDFRTPESIGQVFAVPLPAGDYEFYQFDFQRLRNVMRAYGGFDYAWKAKSDYAWGFVIQPGKATYVGELKLDAITVRNLFGLVRFDGGRWQVSDQRARDLPLLQSRLPADIAVGDPIVPGTLPEAMYAPLGVRAP